MRNAAYHLQAAFLGIELNNHQVNSFVIIHISRIVTQCGLMKTHHPNVVCPSWSVRVKPQKPNKGELKMKQLMNCMASCMVLLLLSGCMDTASRFWNNGLPISERKSKDYRECYSEVRAQDPVMAKSNLTQSELEKFYDRVGSCMQSKGYE